MAEKPNPFLLPSQQIAGRGIDDLNRMDKQAQALQFMKSINPAMRQAGFSQDIIVPWEQEQGVHPMSPEAHPNVQSTFEQETQAATARGDTDAYNARVDQHNRENPGGRQMFRLSRYHAPQMRTAEFTRTTPDFTSRGPITPPANIGGDPRAVSSYPHLNEYMMRDTSPPMNTGGDPRAIQGAVRLPYDVTSAQDTVAARDSASEPKSSQGSAYYSPESGYRPGEMEPVDPILYEALPTPRTPAQVGASISTKSQTGQPLDAEERQFYRDIIRKQLQEAGYTEEQTHRQLLRIDQTTGMLPPRIR